MSDFYTKLTERARELNAEREALINLRKTLLNELEVISSSLASLDKNLEENYTAQEEYWATTDPEPESELTFTNDVLKEYYQDPNLQLWALAKKTNVTLSKVNRIITNHFQEKLKQAI